MQARIAGLGGGVLRRGYRGVGNSVDSGNIFVRVDIIIIVCKCIY